MKHRSSRVDADRELRLHVEQAAEEYAAAGLPPDEARRRALADFGSVAATAEQCRDVNALSAWFDRLRQDLGYGWRVLNADRGYAAAAIAALGLGLGANIAVFTLFDAVALRPLDVPAPSEVVEVTRSTPDAIGGVFSYPDYLFLRDRVPQFRGIAAMSAEHLHLVSTPGVAPSLNSDFAGIRAPRTLGDAQPVLGLFVSTNYFSVMRIAPVRGRVFDAADDQQVAGPFPALLSEDFWRRRFGGDERILGSRLTFSAIPATVVGITPAGHRGIRPQVPDVWLPLGAQEPLARRAADARSLCCQVVARLARGETVARAQSTAAAITRDLPSFALSDARPVISLAPAVPYGRTRRAFQILFSAFLQPAIALVLLIACANAAGLALGRAASRRREIAMRLALGASRGRIVRQLLTEGVLVALIAAALALLAARWLVGTLATAALSWLANSGFSDGGTVLLDVAMRPSLVVYTLVLAVVAGFAFALPPALQTSKADLGPTLAERSSASASRGVRLRRWMVGVQLAVCLMLLVAAASLIGSSISVLRLDLGVAAANVVDLMVEDPHDLGRSDAASGPSRDDIAAALGHTPGVVGTAFTSRIPLAGGAVIATARALGDRAAADSGGSPIVPITFVSRSYFSTIGIRLLEGRTFGEQEQGPAAAVAIVSNALAKRLWPGADPIGQRLAIGSPNRARFQFQADAFIPSATVVGVAADVHSISALTTDSGAIYLPGRAAAWPTHVLVRTSAPADRAASTLAAAVARVHPELAVAFQPLDEALRLSSEFVLARLGGLVFSGIGVLALVLACLGIYSQVGYTVAQQVRELAIRIALGASRRDVLALVVRRTAGPLASGVAGGLLLGGMASRVLAAFLPSTGPAGAAAVVAATLTLSAVALVSALIPARRAATLDPAVVLRAD